MKAYDTFASVIKKVSVDDKGMGCHPDQDDFELSNRQLFQQEVSSPKPKLSCELRSLESYNNQGLNLLKNMLTLPLLCLIL